MTTTTWLTPLHIIDALGPFDLDPCGYRGHPTAKRLICLPEDGLAADWGEDFVWLNPPYGREIGPWMSKMMRHNEGIALVFSRTDTKWWQDAADRSSCVMFLRGRVRFIDPTNPGANAPPAAPCLMTFGPRGAMALSNARAAGTIQGRLMYSW